MRSSDGCKETDTRSKVGTNVRLESAQLATIDQAGKNLIHGELMAPPSRIQLSSLAVDYIDNRLQIYHPAFIRAPTHYSLEQERYVASSRPEAMSIHRKFSLTAKSRNMPRLSCSDDEECATSPPLCTFADVLQRFKTDYPNEPKGRCEKGCSIRSNSSWEEVLNVLQSATQAYLSKTGIKGKVRMAARFIGDKAEPVQRLTALVPEIDHYTRPVVGTLKIVLDVRPNQ